jgi:hypothetical protein
MPAYDEIRDESGAMRSPYAAIRARTSIDVTRPAEPALSALYKPGLVGSQGIYPIPLVLDDDEYRSTIVPGMLQRAFLLQALFEDIAVGSVKLLDAGILGVEQLDCILQSEAVSMASLRQMWRGQAREQIRFVYAPDLVRNPAGNWVTLEDNVGCVGGVAQGPATRDAYLQATGLPADCACTSPSDLERAVSEFLDRAGVGRNTNGLYGFAGGSPQSGPCFLEFETGLKADCLRSLGITVVEPKELIDQVRRGTKVAAIVNLSSTLTSSFRDLATLVFRELEIPIFGAPCVGLIASKSFLPFDEALARLYFGEPLTIPSASSLLISERPARLPNQGVLKRSNGCQGTEVFFLDEMGRDASKDLLASIQKWGYCAAILQEFIERSVLNGGGPGVLEAASLELRPIVYVYGWRAAVVGEVMAARAITHGDRHGNISRGALCVPVLREALRQTADKPVRESNVHASSPQ